MATSLLITKLYIPPVRAEIVPRPHLVERLNAGLGHKLTLVSAPAGFGKTTLLSEWIAGCGRPGAWISLDEGDNDPARFLAYIVAALKTIEPGIGEGALSTFQAPQPPPMELALTPLINDIAAVARPFILVLDDYHLITGQPIHDALAFLLDHLPANMHLVIASRADPHLPVARLRGRGQLSELRLVDLRFTLDEAAQFLNEVMGLGLSAEDVAALASRTEGWIAGLQMAAVSMQGRRDIARFVRAFTGSSRYVLDYLLEEVLQRQPDRVQTFLLQTSILERLTGDLCDALTAQRDGQETLERLERSNLFIIPLDDERQWYRYHRLFADLLRVRLQQTMPDQVPELHCRAAEWCEQNGLMVEAVGHAFAAGDMERAALLVEATAQEMMWRQGELLTLLGWLNTLPDELLRARPRLCVAHAFTLSTVSQFEAVEARLRDAEAALETAPRPDDDADTRAILGEIAVLRAMMANFQGDVPRTIELSHQVLERIPESDSHLRGSIAMNLGVAYWRSGDVVAAGKYFAEASRVSKALGNTFTALFADSYLAELCMIQGQLRQAAKIYEEAVELAAEFGVQHSLGAAMAHVGLGGLLREQNDLDGATHHLAKGIELAEGQGEMVIGPAFLVLMGGYVSMARVLKARGDAKSALEMSRKAEKLARKSDPSYLLSVGATRARLSLAQGNLVAAARWAQESGLQLDNDLIPQHEFEYLTLVRVFIAQGQPDAAQALLARLQQSAGAAGRVGSQIEILALEALALEARGQTAEALLPLERALILAEAEGYVRIFVDEGPPMEGLLKRALAHSIARDYVRRLLTSFGEAARPVSPRAQPLIEPLSQRELEVLRLIADGFSNQEIAETLVIALSTVKKHVSNIFGKLGVTSRTQAVARARELGLM